jgi:hypothetical protein
MASQEKLFQAIAAALEREGRGERGEGREEGKRGV